MKSKITRIEEFPDSSKALGGGRWTNIISSLGETIKPNFVAIYIYIDALINGNYLKIIKLNLVILF
jgi:hypothetical protein